MSTYDRYEKFRSNGTLSLIPFIPIPTKNTDIYIEYVSGVDRLDKISQIYYKNPNYGWLILQANPQFGSMEFNIPNKSQLRVPYPLNTTLTTYQSDIDDYIKKYEL